MLTLANATNSLTVSNAETLTGGTGRDTASYEGSASGVSVDLVEGKGSGGDAHVVSLDVTDVASIKAAVAHAETVACHLTYGGETRLVEAAPSVSPYAVAPVAIGSYFLFRIVFRTEPADLAGIKLYAYADRDGGPVRCAHGGQSARPRFSFSGLRRAASSRRARQYHQSHR